MKILVKQILSVIILFVSCLTCIGQSEMNVLNIDLDDYPNVQMKVVERNPDGNLDEFYITENETKVDSLHIKLIESKVETEGKCVLILFENHYLIERDKERQFFQDIIQGLPNSSIASEDQVYMASFDWSRDENNDKVLFLNSQNHVNSADEVKIWSNSITRSSYLGHTADNGKSAMIYRALDEGINFLNAIDTDLPKAIIILSGEFNYTFDPTFNDPTSIISQGLEKNISIYSLGYDIGKSETYRLNKISESTFGLANTYSNNQLGEAKNTFNSYWSEIPLRASGKTYEISYVTPFDKDGKLRSCKIFYNSSDKSGTSYSYNAPEQSFMELAMANLFFTISFLVLFLLILILIIVMARNSKKKKQLLELENQRKIEEIEQANVKSQEQIKQQQEQLKYKEERERIQQDHLLEKERQIERQKREDAAILEMKQKGFPRLMGTFEGQQGEFVIDKPNILIGRSQESYIPIMHSTVSGKHAEINYLSGSYMVKDLNSTNGTRVNGRNINEQVLKHGDIVEFGEIALTFFN